MESSEIRSRIRTLIHEYWQERSRHERFVPGETKVQYSGPVYDDEEISAMMDTILDGWFGVGKNARQFELEFSQYLGTRETIVTNSGSSANLIALSALKSNQMKGRMEEGDEVVVAALTFPTTFNPIIQTGMKPVLVDVDLGTYNPNPQLIEESISEKTRAIMVLHQLGNPNAMDQIMKIAEKHRLFVIEDTCDALGSRYDGRYVGTFGSMSTFSFYVAHHITMGEGGALTTNDRSLALICRSLRDWGRACACPVCDIVSNPNLPCLHKTRGGVLPDGYDIRYVYTNIGYNLKPMEFQTAMGRVQLKKIAGFIEKRNRNFEALRSTFAKYPEHFILPQALPKAEPAWFAFPLTIRDGAPFSRKEILKYLDDCNIETRLFFAGNIIRHPAYLGLQFRTVSNLENADKVLRDGFFMGIYPGITGERMDYVLDKVEQFMKRW
jgi:CDP-6-deoxy-D-xylo-4-hexulose-3-dehydrase